MTNAVGTARRIVAGDFNGDGRTDLAVANYGSDDVSVLLGNGDGTFQNQVPTRRGPAHAPSWRGTSTATAGTDLAVANYGSNDVSVLLGNGDGTFQDQVTYAVGDRPDRARGGRLQRRRPPRPGRRQLQSPTTCPCCWATATAPSRTRCTYSVGTGPSRDRGGRLQRRRPPRPGRRQPDSDDVSVLLGNGDGTFQDQVPYAVGTRPRRPRGGRLQRRRPDRPGRRQLRLRRRVGAAGQRRRHLPGPGDVLGGDRAQTPIVAGDFNGDGRPDLAVANSGSDDVSVLLGNGDGTFQDQVHVPGVGTRAASHAIVAGDFNGDGRTDLAVANYGSNDVSVLLGTATARSRPPARSPPPPTPRPWWQT